MNDATPSVPTPDDPKRKLTAAQVLEAGLTDWRQLDGTLHARFATKNFAAGLRLVDAIGAVAEEADHHPDLTLTYTAVKVSMSSHDVGALTSRDIDLARRISALAAEQGVSAQPESVSVVQIALDTPDRDRIMPFWAAVLGYDADADELRDPHGEGPLLWFQPSFDGSEAAQRFHYDIWVPHDVARTRIDAAIAAGGTVARDESPSFVALRDPEGNHACICTALDRD